MKRKAHTTAANGGSKASKRQKAGEAAPTTRQTRLSLRLSKRQSDLDPEIKNEDPVSVTIDDVPGGLAKEEGVSAEVEPTINAKDLEEQQSNRGKGRATNGKIEDQAQVAKKEDVSAEVEMLDTKALEGQQSKKGKGRAEKPKDARPKAENQGQKAKGYGIIWGVSPYPKWNRPTAEECREVVSILSQYHGDQVPAKAMPPPSLTRAGCGNVPAVHDALLRTLLSAATQTENANAALDNLVRVYGVAEEGVGKGSINWNAVRLSSQEKLFKTIQCGGLAGGKSRDIKKILDQIVLENKERCEKLVANGETLAEEVSTEHYR